MKTTPKTLKIWWNYLHQNNGWYRTIVSIFNWKVNYKDFAWYGECSTSHFCRTCPNELAIEQKISIDENNKRLYPPSIISSINVYRDQWPLYNYADKYWDKNVNKKSLTKAICRAMEDKECPFHIDPYESLVDNCMYDEEEDNINDNIRTNYWKRDENKWTI